MIHQVVVGRKEPWMENEAKKPLELYIHIPFCVKNAITVISFPDLPEKRGSVNISRLWKGRSLLFRIFGQGDHHSFYRRRNTFRAGSVSCWRDAGSDQK